ncbi:MAG: ArnT family glycosyltransferase [Planctomycetota bacterium]
MVNASAAPTPGPLCGARLWGILAALLGLAWVWAVPPFMGPDEPWHLERAEHVASGAAPFADLEDYRLRLAELGPSAAQTSGRFPGLSHERIVTVQRAILASMHDERWFARVDWAERPGAPLAFDLIQESITAARQPPLYYAILGGWLALCPSEDFAVRVRFARLPSVLCFVLLVLAARALGRRMGGDEVGDLAGLVALLLPPSARIAATVNNDSLAIGLAAAATLLACTDGVRGRWLFVVLLAGLAAWTKGTALPVFGALGVWGALGVRGSRTALPPLRVGLAAIGLVALALWVLRDSPVLPASMATTLERLESGLSIGTWGPVVYGVLGASNWGSRPASSGLLIVLGILSIVAVIGLLFGARSVQAQAGSRAYARLALLILAAQCIAVVLRGVGTARYLWPAAPALCAILALGWCLASRSAWRTPLVAALLALWHASVLVGGILVEERMVLGS